jgi:hypothetical protein
MEASGIVRRPLGICRCIASTRFTMSSVWWRAFSLVVVEYCLEKNEVLFCGVMPMRDLVFTAAPAPGTIGSRCAVTSIPSKRLEVLRERRLAVRRACISSESFTLSVLQVPGLFLEGCVRSARFGVKDKDRYLFTFSR